MSKYPLRYHSESKKADIDIEAMPTPHLMNAWRKLGDDPDKVALRQFMGVELLARGCALDTATGRWAMPQKSEEAAS